MKQVRGWRKRMWVESKIKEAERRLLMDVYESKVEIRIDLNSRFLWTLNTDNKGHQ